MGIKIINEISSPKKIREELPLRDELREQVNKHTAEIKDILSGIDNRKLMVVGPCSAWPNKAVIEYANKLAQLQDQVEDKVKLVMRTYIQKPRTTIGWTGPLNQPDPTKEPNLEAGIRYCRRMMLDVLETGLPIADEALFLWNGDYFNDLLSWVAIGARSAEDAEHRHYASSLDIPVGMKNGTDGGIEKGVNSVLAAQHPHHILSGTTHVLTCGNPYAHLVLRGGGPQKTNYDEVSLGLAIQHLEKKGIINPAIVVDLSHDNAYNSESGKKDPNMQPVALKRVLKTMREDKGIERTIKGFMCESFILEGNQSVGTNTSMGEINLSGHSITDPCLGYKATQEMLLDMYEALN